LFAPTIFWFVSATTHLVTPQTVCNMGYFMKSVETINWICVLSSNEVQT